MLEFLKPTIYIRLNPEIISVRNVRTGKSIDEPPLIAISGGIKVEGSVLQGGATYTGTNPVVLAVGFEAKALANRPDVKIVNPFVHPRTPLSDLPVTEIIIKKMVRKLLGRMAIVFPPTIFLHWTVDLEGGPTQIEVRAFRELCMAAGAKKSYVWFGGELTDSQINGRKLPINGTVS